MKWIGAVALSICISAHAEFKDGNNLLDDMNASDYFSRGVALGYVMGVSDMGQGVVHCAPPNATAGQVQDMVKNYLTNTPAERHRSADAIVNKVLKSVWPCAARSRGNPT